MRLTIVQQSYQPRGSTDCDSCPALLQKLDLLCNLEMLRELLGAISTCLPTTRERKQPTNLATALSFFWNFLAALLRISIHP